MNGDDRDRLFRRIEDLVMCHSPSGMEREVDAHILAVLARTGVEHRQDRAGNIIARIPGMGGSEALAVTAHKDEIGAVVKAVRGDGTLEVRKLGGAFPWVYGEGVVDLLGDRRTVQGILSFGSRHVSHESPQKIHQDDIALKWEHVWVETKLSREDCEEAGIRPGTRMVVGKHRKAPLRLGQYVASYTLDNKASVAILLCLAERLVKPWVDTYLVFSAKEEVGAIGAMHFTREQPVAELIALEIIPKSAEYPFASDQRPVLISQDGHGLYDEDLNARLEAAAARIGIVVQRGILNQFGSDASLVMKSGHVPQAACLGFPTDNTHGFEVAHLGAIEACLDILLEYCSGERCG